MPAFSKTARIAVYSAFVVSVILVLGTPGPFSAAQAKTTYGAADYAGIWRLMFQGKAFASLTIEQKGFQFSGSLTGVSIEMDDNGKLTRAVANGGPASTLHAALQNGALHLSEKDGDDTIEWTMTLNSATTGELRFAEGGPANAEAIRLEKVWSEPPVE